MSVFARPVLTVATIVLPIATLAIAGVAPAAEAQSGPDTSTPIVVILEAQSETAVLGDSLRLDVVVTNTGSVATAPLVVRLDITDPSAALSVDPEDWTPTLNQLIGALGPAQSVMVTWDVQPIAGGRFALYAVALSADADSVAASNLIHLAVEDQRTLNPGGILPVAIAAPSLIGMLLVWQRRRAGSTRLA